MWPRAMRLAILCLAFTACSRSFTSPASSPMQVRAVPPVAAPRERVQLQITGGQPPFQFAWAPGSPKSGDDAQLPDAQLRYRVGSAGNAVDELVVTDAAGASQKADVSVGPPLTLSPRALSLQPGDQVSFLAQGGKPPYRFDLTSACPACADGGAEQSCLGASDGTYRAGTGCPGTTDHVAVTDAVGVSEDAAVQLGGGVSVLPADADVGPGEALTLTASGGVPPYTFRFDAHGNASGGTLTSFGAYVAGISADVTDDVIVEDSAHGRAVAHLHVGNPRVGLPQVDQFQLVRGDFNGDGFTDVVAVATAGQPQLVLVPGSATGWGTVAATAMSALGCGASVGDFDGDGLDDVAVNYEVAYSSFDGTGLACLGARIYYGQPGGTFRLGPSFQIDPSKRVQGSPPVALDLRAGGLPVVLAAAWIDSSYHPYLDLLTVDGAAASNSTALGPGPLRELGLIGPVQQQEFFEGYFIDLRPIATGDGGVRVLYGSYDSSGCSNSPAQYDVQLSSPLQPSADGGLQASFAYFDDFYFDCLGDGAAFATADLAGAGVRDVLAVSVGGRAAARVYRLPGRSDGGFGSPERYDLGDVASTALARAATAGGPARELDLVVSGRVERLELDGGQLTAAFPDVAIGAGQLVDGDFNGDGLPDLAGLDPDGRLALFPGSVGGALSAGNTFSASVGALQALLSMDLDGDGIADIAAGGQGLELFGARPDGRLSAEGMLAPTAQVSALAPGAGQSAWAAATDAQGHGELFSFTMAGGIDAGSTIRLTQLGLPDDRPVRGLFAFDGGLLVTGHDVIQLDALWAAPLAVADDGGLALLAPPWTQDIANQAAPVELNGAPYPDLAVVTNDGVNDPPYALELFAATPSGPKAWSTTPLQKVDLGAYIPPGYLTEYNYGLISFALHPGGRRDHVACWNLQSLFGDCPADVAVWVDDLSSGAAPTSPSFSVGFTDLCSPDFEVRPYAADFDGDGNTDVAVFTGRDSNVAVLWGLGDGGFSAGELHVAGTLNGVVEGRFGDGGALAVSRADIPQILLVPLADVRGN